MVNVVIRQNVAPVCVFFFLSAGSGGPSYGNAADVVAGAMIAAGNVAGSVGLSSWTTLESLLFCLSLGDEKRTHTHTHTHTQTHTYRLSSAEFSLILNEQFALCSPHLSLSEYCKPCVLLCLIPIEISSRFFQFLLRFTGFYWVLLGFTRFY